MMHALPTGKRAFQGATVLTPTGWVSDATVLVEDGQLISVDQAPSPSGFAATDVSGLTMLPGLVDIHGDAFERMICPRPGVHFPLEIAIAENDRALLASGITTFFYAITDSFEPGLRSRDTARQIVEWVLNPEVPLKANSRIHIRHEQGHTAGHEELCEWMATGKVHLLSFNNHLPPSTDEETLLRYTQGLRQRIRRSDGDIRALVEAAKKQEEAGFHQVEQLVDQAHQLQIPIASHDDESEADVALSARRGMAIAEFPASIPLARQSQDYGASVLMGAPNLVRGGSHVGYMSAADAARAGVLDCLCSDYHYPSLFGAPFKLAHLGLMPFEEAWKRVSTHPAAAAGIGDQKGAIAPGLDADFLLVRLERWAGEPPVAPTLEAIAAVIIGGQEVARFR